MIWLWWIVVGINSITLLFNFSSAMRGERVSPWQAIFPLIFIILTASLIATGTIEFK